MRLRYIPFILIFLVTAIVSAPADALDEVLEELDYLHFFDRNEEIIELLDQQNPRTDREEGQLLWRRARSLVAATDLYTWEGSMSDRDAIALLEDAEAYADRAIELLPDEAEPYFWKAASMGQRALLRGVLNSLFMASDVRDFSVLALEREEDLAEVYYLLTQVYRQLPGWPISFGNNDYAVSLGRRAVDLYEDIKAAGETPVEYWDHYTQLAEALWTRNNNARQRDRRVSRASSEFRNAASPLERGFHYEGTVSIPGGTDRQEALEIVRRVVRELSAVSEPRLRQRMELAEARELLESWE